MFDMRMNKKLAVVVTGIVLAAGISFFTMGHLFNKVSEVGGELRMLEHDMASARHDMTAPEKFQQAGHLLTRQEVSLAIDEMMKVGSALGIHFLSINPQKIERSEGLKYPVLPIRMDVRSEYKDLGLFLGALARLEESIVTVKSFQVEADQKILPQVETHLVIEVYLREGEDG